ncbi:MAG: multidrug transporter [Clostridiales Family XIII bacterium]|jgi:drug/metabolite transporter (DMT)-like permease|nr:multidrug transporter [Clostridiales Family XIII bacterium]
MNTILLYAMLIAGCALGAFASYFFKGASGALNGLNVTILLRQKTFWLGGLLYLVAAVNNIFLLRYFDYSILLPMSSITYIWTMVIASRLLGEQITKRKIFGVCAIIAGAVLISQG